MVLILFVCLLTNASYCSSSLFGLIGSLLSIGIIPLIWQFNNSVVGLGSTGPSGVDVTCNKAICMSDLVTMHFLVVCFINLMQPPPVHCSGDSSMTSYLYNHCGQCIHNADLYYYVYSCKWYIILSSSRLYLMWHHCYSVSYRLSYFFVLYFLGVTMKWYYWMFIHLIIIFRGFSPHRLIIFSNFSWLVI